MAPESLRDGVFTTSSDVWSFGVVLWEMATLATQPYQGLGNEEVLKHVIDGHLLEQPEGCPQEFYNLMRICWHYNKNKRITFYQILLLLQPQMPAGFTGASWFFQHRDELLRRENLPSSDLEAFDMDAALRDQENYMRAATRHSNNGSLGNHAPPGNQIYYPQYYDKRASNKAGQDSIELQMLSSGAATTNTNSNSQAGSYIEHLANPLLPIAQRSSSNARTLPLFLFLTFPFLPSCFSFHFPPSSKTITNSTKSIAKMLA